MKKVIIGIDFGTTNCTMAYAFAEEDAIIQQFKIPQIIQANLFSEHFSFPSFIYFPMQEEIKAEVAKTPWNDTSHVVTGFFAKERGQEIPDRVIASSKSWACFSNVDRKKAFLPLHSDQEFHLSPLDACSLLFKSLKESWNYQMKEYPFDEADILVTVPASFDPSARELIKEAATLAGYPEIVLLEEPQAAFYAWLHKQKDWRNILKLDDTVLVIDIGGGTTDFSLIKVESENGDLVLKRIAVGDHLLLGGDNIDLSLAYLAKNKLEEAGHTIDERQFQALTYLCRNAKEQLLSNEAPKHVDITLIGRGSRLMQSTLKTKLTKEEVLTFVVDGFIPFISKEEKAEKEKQAGLSEIGLPFAKDPRISAQLAKFLSECDSNKEFTIPTKVLFNGGTLKGARLQERLLELLNGFAKEASQKEVIVLEDNDLDYAVSVGAVSYGLSRLGKAIRIKSGTARSYFIGVEDAMPAIPGIPKSMKAFCVAPFGMEEGSESEALKQEFALAVGESATFRFFSMMSKTLSSGDQPVVGTQVTKLSELTELSPIETFLEKNEQDGKAIRVKLKSKVTELGFLELWCVAEDNRKWKLEFSIR